MIENTSAYTTSSLNPLTPNPVDAEADASTWDAPTCRTGNAARYSAACCRCSFRLAIMLCSSSLSSSGAALPWSAVADGGEGSGGSGGTIAIPGPLSPPWKPFRLPRAERRDEGLGIRGIPRPRPRRCWAIETAVMDDDMEPMRDGGTDRDMGDDGMRSWMLPLLPPRLPAPLR